ncbi:type II secretion system protein [Actinocorallia sp. API 0066]|uniref:type II secretion system F family protein n=1 Tax=Actinocorallia sp. API 0066 TaxID=2896846 RepID=UPI001E4FAD54|nr:type II secretion system F family protein [Actinocorallia sp. API 0066]MCD0453071.1 type II secretion system protein [Actinocorallia sp. API 0066]
MTVALLAGALAGIGLFLLLRALFPARRGLRALVAEYDSVARRGNAPVPQPTGDDKGKRPSLTRRLEAEVGSSVARMIEDRGWELRSTRADLAILDRDYEQYLANKVLAPAVALAFVPLFVGLLALFTGLSVMIPVWGGLLFAVAAFFFPDLQLRQDAAKAREDFRHVVGAFLDLVAMNLAGGRGVPEALMTASQIGGGDPMLRIREALANARIVGHTPWQALGALGDRIAVAELSDLASALALVADDGAKIRQSLAARAGSMRSREISALEGRAGQNSQTMLVAQLSFCLGFMVFLLFPSAMKVLL